jgi:acid phosphatase type 7
MAVFLGMTMTTAAASPVIVAAGDIASKGKGDTRTARLVRRLNPDRVLTLGDNAYGSGTHQQFRDYYDPTWGTFRAKTRPSPGNHDYGTGRAGGYFDYFGPKAPAKNYTFVIGNWLLVSLDSWSDRAAAQTFLRKTLAYDNHACELVYWHQPRWSSGEHGSDGRLGGLWRLAVRRGVDVVLTGHDHDYERFARLNAFGQPVPSGTREFVVGTGGVGLRGFGHPVRGSQKRIRSLGVLRMELRPNAYLWSFRNLSNRSLDRGSTVCHR